MFRFAGAPFFRTLLLATFALGGLARADPLVVKIGVMRVQHSRETISIRDIPAGDDFVAGAKLAVADDNTTGRFLDQTFAVEDVKLAPDDDAVVAAKELLDSGVRYLIVDLPADKLLQVADAARDTQALVFNGGAPDESVREEDCRSNLIHTAPSRAMLADALAHYLMWKRWRKWLLVVGSHPEDAALGAAYERSAKKFGAAIVERRTFEDAGGGRRSNSASCRHSARFPSSPKRRQTTTC